jgi:hypothetical protein
MTLGDVLLYLFTGASVVAIAFVGTFTVASLITVGVFLGKLISKRLPELWERIP